MDLYDYLRFGAAMIFVLTLMVGLSYVLKRFNLGGNTMISPAKRRLKIIEILPLDGRRKAMLIRRDNTEHLVILSSSGETVVETNIKPPAKNTVKKKEKKKNDKKIPAKK